MQINKRFNAELHLHLGGAILPRILYEKLRKDGDKEILRKYGSYSNFEDDIYEREIESLDDYLMLHTMAESIQRMDRLNYFVRRLLRGAYWFEGICYLELRYTPYFRTDEKNSENVRIRKMWEVVDIIAEAAKSEGLKYPLLLKQILCLHTTLSTKINREIVNLAAEMHHTVCGIDIAGPDEVYKDNAKDIVSLFEYAKEKGLKTTGHVYETKNGAFPELLPLLDRIGHGIQIPLHHENLLPEIAKRNQCLEVSPTSYLKTRIMKNRKELKPVFEKCEEYGVDIAICTDNSGFNMVRLPYEYENLLIHEVITFEKLQECRDAAFKHAFGWPYNDPPKSVVDKLIRDHVEYPEVFS